MIEKRKLIIQMPGYEEAEIQLYYVSEFKELLKNIEFRDIRFNPLIVLTTLIPKDLVRKHFSRIAKIELKLSHNPNLLPLALRIRFACTKA